MAENIDIMTVDPSEQDLIDIDVVSGSPPHQPHPPANEDIQIPVEPPRPQANSSNTAGSASTCSYKGKPCTSICLSGYQYCLKHILEDKSAPYKRCTMIKSESKRRCATAVPINDPDPALCGFHRKKVSEEAHAPKEQQPKEVDPATRTKKRVVRPPPVEIRDSPSDKEQRERFFTKMVNNAGLLGRVALIATPDELDAVQEQRSHNPGGRMDKIRNNIIDMKLRALRNELEVERAFLFSPIEAVDEFSSIISEARARIPKKEPESVKVPDATMGPPKDAVVKKKTSKKAEAGDVASDEQTEKKKKKKSATEAPPAAPVVVEPPKPKRKTRFDYPTTCTFVGCEERAVPLTHYCFAHILNEENQQLYEPCPWEDCGYPKPKFSKPAFCAFHVEMSEKEQAATVKKSAASIPPPHVATATSTTSDQPQTPSALSIIANKLAHATAPEASSSGEPVAAPPKKPRKRKAPDAATAGADATPEGAPPKKKRKSKAASAAPTATATTPQLPSADPLPSSASSIVTSSAAPMESYMGTLTFEQPIVPVANTTPTTTPAFITIEPNAWNFDQEQVGADELFPNFQLPSNYAESHQSQPKG
eukprot:TRINITY_DN5722_c0_g1_i1.p1 TRINITY_DN5722_c0_g1~~TRINITY_DN5722_c0_g1_i1.p1  ORF type:complete len:593 (-),score=134.53 TRINITY_DN5722_c0_g1_i1:806-2584(-)